MRFSCKKKTIKKLLISKLVLRGRTTGSQSAWEDSSVTVNDYSYINCLNCYGLATYFNVWNKNPFTSSVSSSSAFRTVVVSLKSDMSFTDLVTEKCSSEWVIHLQLTIYFGVIHGFVFCAFDSQLNTVARQEHFLRLWMLHRRRSRAVTWIQQCSSWLTTWATF